MAKRQTTQREYHPKTTEDPKTGIVTHHVQTAMGIIAFPIHDPSHWAKFPDPLLLGKPLWHRILRMLHDADLPNYSFLYSLVHRTWRNAFWDGLTCRDYPFQIRLEHIPYLSSAMRDKVEDLSLCNQASLEQLKTQTFLQSFTHLKKLCLHSLNMGATNWTNWIQFCPSSLISLSLYDSWIYNSPRQEQRELHFDTLLHLEELTIRFHTHLIAIKSLPPRLQKLSLQQANCVNGLPMAQEWPIQTLTHLSIGSKLHSTFLPTFQSLSQLTCLEILVDRNLDGKFCTNQETASQLCSYGAFCWPHLRCLKLELIDNLAGLHLLLPLAPKLHFLHLSTLSYMVGWDFESLVHFQGLRGFHIAYGSSMKKFANNACSYLLTLPHLQLVVAQSCLTKYRSYKREPVPCQVGCGCVDDFLWCPKKIASMRCTPMAGLDYICPCHSLMQRLPFLLRDVNKDNMFLSRKQLPIEMGTDEVDALFTGSHKNFFDELE